MEKDALLEQVRKLLVTYKEKRSKCLIKKSKRSAACWRL